MTKSLLGRTPVSFVMSDRKLQTRLLLRSGQLLLEYNESTGEIHRALTAAARALSDEPCLISVTYGGVAVYLGGAEPAPR